jgi:hypothetical protein
MDCHQKIARWTSRRLDCHQKIARLRQATVLSLLAHSGHGLNPRSLRGQLVVK